jgi:beta-galactosidase/beta-glucuronidase
VRGQWKSLDGVWAFAVDDDRVGEREGWHGVDAAERFPLQITVPFPPESPASGVHDTGFHPVVWYRRTLTADDLVAVSSAEDRTLLHFGAVDHRAKVWLDGALVGEHEGGQTPFAVDVSPHLVDGREEHVLVVRAEDDPLDATLPRGKQDWELRPHGIWYHRTTGIWQTVWTETVPALRIADVAWTPLLTQSSVQVELTLSQRPATPVTLDVSLAFDGREMARVSLRVDGPRVRVTLPIPALANGQNRAWYTWSPEHPALFDARLELASAREGGVLDRVDSYFGMRSAGVGRGHFLLNGQAYYVRSVLNQGYRQDTHLANTGSDALRHEVELIKAMGFNAVRVHQKAEDPRFLYWTDRLGLLVWAETANAFEFSTHGVELLTREWLDLVRRDRSHPSVVTWVPVNESWGVQDISADAAQQSYTVALASLTRALDPSRPVLSNEGWEHIDSDILGLHDYSTSGEVLLSRYGDIASIRATLDSPGPSGRIPLLSEAQRTRFDAGDAPLMITEFGGISYAGGGATWGYATVTTDEEYAARLEDIFDALRACPGVVGFCYTQFIDTVQEANGVVRSNLEPKLPLEQMRRIVTGRDDSVDAPTSTMGWIAKPQDTEEVPSTPTQSNVAVPSAEIRSGVGGVS